jgi:DNA-binding response OmpR family regulator
MKLLLIEDEPELAQSVRQFLLQEGYQCEWASDFNSAEEKIQLYEYDCVIVDLMLPGGSGLTLIEQLKKARSLAGIVVISAKNALDDRIRGLDLGADDYLTKPFHLSELNARLKSLLRRRRFEGNREVFFGDLAILPETGEVRVGQHSVPLTRKEFDLLLYLVSNAGRVLSRGALAEHLWGDDMDQVDSFDVLYTHVKNLRKKLLSAGCPDYLQTLYGTGYKFVRP